MSTSIRGVDINTDHPIVMEWAELVKISFVVFIGDDFVKERSVGIGQGRSL